MEEEQSVMLVGLTPRQQECALERYALLRPCLEEGMTQSRVAREQQVSFLVDGAAVDAGVSGRGIKRFGARRTCGSGAGAR
ncbi:hypothetical protein KSZ_50660 [Dictyobacter formicarum]|uniref:Helix-turn-helix domain-containing protein n=1 Tax=Dictyobacter formicarum TaxID=2778368 RepID=A0ABQ3VMN6_9CHLR|nr:hypothetical protein KSZ_50660 [Dictyobacter formicarum]